MLVASLKPTTLPGSDDQYLKIVNQFADTISNVAQIQALESLGIMARIEANADFSTLEE